MSQKGMQEFIKVQFGSILGNAADFLVTILCTELGLSWYLISNIMGNCAGGTIQFALSRQWIFKKNSSGITGQFLKFLLFFLGNILLSAAGIYFFTQFLHTHYIISKLLCSIILGLTYNYYIQKYFVFA
jgi:putative flippase GtrA